MKKRNSIYFFFFKKSLIFVKVNISNQSLIFLAISLGTVSLSRLLTAQWDSCLLYHLRKTSCLSASRCYRPVCREHSRALARILLLLESFSLFPTVDLASRPLFGFYEVSLSSLDYISFGTRHWCGTSVCWGNGSPGLLFHSQILKAQG